MGDRQLLTLSDRQLMILSVFAAREAAAWYKPHMKPYQYYHAIADAMEAKLGPYSPDEVDKAQEAALGS